MDPPEMHVADVERFRAKIKPSIDSKCWAWIAALSRDGYGQFKVREQVAGRGRVVQAHRIAHYIASGDWPEVAMHACDNPPCCNPAHITGADVQTNRNDMFAKGRNAKGERHGSAKLCAADVVDIRKRHASGETITEIARRYPIVGASAIEKIASRKKWTHVR